MRCPNKFPTLVLAGLLSSAALTSGARAEGENPSFRLINRRDIPVAGVYATPSGLDNWGRNRLDNTPLAPQAERVFKLPTNGNCFYDLKVVFADKKVREKRHENLCKVSNLPVE